MSLTIDQWISSALVIATFLLAFFTYRLGKASVHQMDLLMKEKKRPQVLEQIHTILVPMMNRIETQEKDFVNGSFEWGSHDGVSYPQEPKLDLGYPFLPQRALWDDFKREYSRLWEELVNYNDNMISKLNEHVKNLASAILTKRLEDECLKLADHERSILLHSSSEKNVDDVAKSIGYSVGKIIFAESLGRRFEPDVAKSFYDRHRDELLRMMNSEDVKNWGDRTAQIMEKCLEKAKSLHSELSKICEEYRRKYDLSATEMYERKIF